MACCIWSVNEWARKWVVVNFAGGPVEVKSEFTALAGLRTAKPSVFIELLETSRTSSLWLCLLYTSDAADE